MLRRGFYICLFALLLLFWEVPVEAASFPGNREEFTIVIDPGHGGDNLGTIANENFEEKEITMKTARALVDELSKYEGVKVLLTREEDVDLSLKERAEFAKKADADFLFSIHYNASENHTLFGSEVWIPLEAPYHALGYQFGYLQLTEMQDLGLFIRGIKTRTNDKGTDYYGIIRESVARDIPAVIIEHCHVDESRDGDYVDEDSDYEEFGRRDARAIAQFLGLEPYVGPAELPELSKEDTIANTYLDDSRPDTCRIDVEYADYDNCMLTVTVNAADKDTPLMYYDYSIDGGETYSKLQPWPESNMLTGTYDDSFSLLIEIPNQTTPQVIVRAYNKFDISSESNLLSDFSVFQIPVPETASPTEAKIPEYQPVLLDETPVEASGISFKRFLLLAGFIIIWAALIALMGLVVYRFFDNRNRPHRK